MNQLKERRMRAGFHSVALVLAAGLAWQVSAAQTLQGAALVSALQHGGYVILKRHASSPRDPPPAAQANPDNVRHERQLDAAGVSAVRAFGAAIRRLRIPVAAVFCSPTYRALETVRLAQLAQPQTREQLGDAGHSMQADTTGARGKWLRMQVAVLPAPGTDTLLVTHLPNITEAFPTDVGGLQDGAALVFRPDGHGGARLVARVGIQEWPRLAAAQ
jgi:phosphohistidine phosphatase SixA